jgi:hypothetical protein
LSREISEYTSSYVGPFLSVRSIILLDLILMSENEIDSVLISTKSLAVNT